MLDSGFHGGLHFEMQVPFDEEGCDELVFGAMAYDLAAYVDDSQGLVDVVATSWLALVVVGVGR